jgi:hypothetical protein
MLRRDRAEWGELATAGIGEDDVDLACFCWTTS